MIISALARNGSANTKVICKRTAGFVFFLPKDRWSYSLCIHLSSFGLFPAGRTRRIRQVAEDMDGVDGIILPALQERGDGFIDMVGFLDLSKQKGGAVFSTKEIFRR